MSKPWLKMWASSLDSEKIQSLSGDQFKVWMNLLWIALRYDQKGDLPELPSIAFQARVSIEQATKLMSEQVSLGLVEKHRSRYCIHDWNHWQGRGLSDAERQAKKRDKSRDMSRDKVCDESRDESVTCHVLAGAKTKTKRDREDKDKDPPLKVPPIFLPEWVPRDDWDGWLEVRKQKKKPLTQRAQKLALGILETYRSQGHSPADLLQAAIVGGWTGLHIPESFNNNGYQGKPHKHESRANDGAYSFHNPMDDLRRQQAEIDAKARERREAKEKAQREQERAQGSKPS